MRYSLFALAAAAAVSAQATSAPETTNNPVGASYVATLPEKKSSVRGSVVGTTGSDGKGVHFSVAFSGLPAEGGPFMYHIHEKPVPTDGNCTGTGAHLDPYKRGETPICDASKKETCQVGDLGGKYGNITKESESFDYLDLYTSTDPSSNAYFGNLAVVVHFSNKTRITCANFTLAAPGTNSSSTASSGYALPTGSGNSTSAGPTGTGSVTTGSPSGTSGSGSAPHSATPTQPAAPTGGAAKMMVGGAGLLAGVVALVL